MRRNNPQEATTRRATPRITGVLCCFSLYNTPRTKQQEATMPLTVKTQPPTPKEQPVAHLQTQYLKGLYADLMRDEANKALKALYISRNQTGNLKDEADFVAGASAMLGMINKVLFGATESEEMNIVPAGWFIYMMSGRGLSELFEEKESNGATS